MLLRIGLPTIAFGIGALGLAWGAATLACIAYDGCVILYAYKANRRSR